MIGLDTNVLVRYIMQDDKQQSLAANGLIGGFSPEEPGFISLVTVVELNWVLSKSFGLSDGDVARMLEGLLRSREMRVERAEEVWGALRDFRASRADLTNCLISRAGRTAGCETTMTFDRAAARLEGMTLLA